MFPDFLRKLGIFLRRKIRRIRHNQIEALSGKWREEITLHERDAMSVRKKRFSVAAGDVQGGFGNIAGGNRGLRQLFMQADRNRAAAGADVHDGRMFKRFRPFYRRFDEMFGFGAGNQDARRDDKFH